MNIVITGATKGIGRATSEIFAAAGHNLCLCSRSIQDLELMKASLLSKFPEIKIHVMTTDVRNKDEVKAFGDFCLEQFDDIDVLINNAGVFIPGVIHEEEEGILETMIETNLYSAYHLSRKLVPSMKNNERGLIVNISSIAGFMAYPNGGSYSISKFALSGFSKVLREELKPFGVKVTTVLPGATWSNSWAGAELPLDRLIQASDIAKSIFGLIDLSPSAVVEEIIIRPQLGDL